MSTEAFTKDNQLISMSVEAFTTTPPNVCGSVHIQQVPAKSPSRGEDVTAYNLGYKSAELASMSTKACTTSNRLLSMSVEVFTQSQLTSVSMKVFTCHVATHLNVNGTPRKGRRSVHSERLHGVEDGAVAWPPHTENQH